MNRWFELGTPALVVVVCVPLLAATAAGTWIGRTRRGEAERIGQALNAVQVALFGFLGLLLAFSLTLAIGRYEDRRVAVVDEANAIGTAYLRARTLPQPLSTEASALLRRYLDERVALSRAVPGSAGFRAASDASEELHVALWSTATRALAAAPQDSAPRLYAEAVNAAIDLHTTRLARLANRMPSSVVDLELLVSVAAVGLLGAFVGLTGRGVVSVLLAPVLVALILLVTFDLDRPVRGVLTVPTTALVDTRALMDRLGG
jgi:hypothetical protein